MKQKFRISSLLISIVIAELVGALSALLSGNSTGDYQALNQPPLSPPGWLFPIAWGILYALMGTAAYLIYQSGADNAQKKKALIFYGAQLFVNFLWSLVFFRFQMYWLSVAVIIILDILLIITMVCFARIRTSAVLFLIPYLLWLLFATYLNIGVAVLNP